MVIGDSHDEVPNYLIVDCKVLLKDLVVRDSKSHRQESSAESGRPEETTL